MGMHLRKQAAEQIWLRYFNQTLFEQSLITEAEQNKMTLRILERKTPIKW